MTHLDVSVQCKTDQSIGKCIQNKCNQDVANGQFALYAALKGKLC